MNATNSDAAFAAYELNISSMRLRTDPEEWVAWGNGGGSHRRATKREAVLACAAALRATLGREDCALCDRPIEPTDEVAVQWGSACHQACADARTSS